MSVQATTWVWEHSKASGTDLLVLLAIADAANRDGRRSYQSAATVAAMTRLSKRTVQRSVARLVELGDIIQEAEKGIRGTSSYALPLHTRPTSPGDVRQNDVRHPGSPPTSPVTPRYDTAMSPEPKTPVVLRTTPQGEARKRATRLPEGWMPSQATIDKMRRDCPGVNLEAEHEKFSDYWAGMSGTRGTKADWDATWRNWIRRANENTQRKDTYVPSWKKRLDANIQAAQADMNRDRGIFEIGE